METTTTQTAKAIITPEIIRQHLQGHRRLTRRTIEAFPDDKILTFSIGGMRPFAELALEMVTMAATGVQGVLTGKWPQYEEAHNANRENLKSKADLLRIWDETTAYIDQVWPQIPAERFLEKDLAFNTWDGTIYWFIQYWVDNEIHHRAQGYVYLRALGIEPPAFWDRG